MRTRLGRGGALPSVAIVLASIGVGWWHAGSAPPAVAPSFATPRVDLEEGKEIYQRDCAICHATDGTGSFRGPSIAKAGEAAVDFWVRTGRMPIDDPDTDPSRHDPAYDTAEIRSLVAYAATFVTGPTVPRAVDVAGADLARGAHLYRLHCAACHQAAGGGGVLAYGITAPSLYDATPLETLEAMRTGPGTMPPFPRATLDGEDAAAVAAYVEYLRDPNDEGGLSLWHLGPVPEGLVAWVFGLGAALALCRWLGQREPLTTE